MRKREIVSARAQAVHRHEISVHVDLKPHVARNVGAGGSGERVEHLRGKAARFFEHFALAARVGAAADSGIRREHELSSARLGPFDELSPWRIDVVETRHEERLVPVGDGRVSQNVVGENDIIRNARRRKDHVLLRCVLALTHRKRDPDPVHEVKAVFINDDGDIGMPGRRFGGIVFFRGLAHRRYLALYAAFSEPVVGHVEIPPADALRKHLPRKLAVDRLPHRLVFRARKIGGTRLHVRSASVPCAQVELVEEHLSVQTEAFERDPAGAVESGGAALVARLGDEEVHCSGVDERSEIESRHDGAAERVHAPAPDDDRFPEFLLEVAREILLHAHRTDLEKLLVSNVRLFPYRVQIRTLREFRCALPPYPAVDLFLPDMERLDCGGREVGLACGELSVVVSCEMHADDALRQSRALQFAHELRHQLLDVIPPDGRMVGDPRPGVRFRLSLHCVSGRTRAPYRISLCRHPCVAGMFVGILRIRIAADREQEKRFRRTAHEILHALYRSGAVEAVLAPESDSAKSDAQTDIHRMEVDARFLEHRTFARKRHSVAERRRLEEYRRHSASVDLQDAAV